MTAVTRMTRIGVAATLLIVVGILRVIVVGRSATALWAIRPLRLFWGISATITAIATILWARRVRRIGRARALLATRWRRIGLLIVPLLPLAIRAIYATASGTIVGHAAARRRSLTWLAVLAVVARRLMARVSLLRVWRLLLGALVGGVRLSGTLAGWLVAATWSGLLLWSALSGSAITRREWLRSVRGLAGAICRAIGDRFLRRRSGAWRPCAADACWSGRRLSRRRFSGGRVGSRGRRSRCRGCAAGACARSGRRICCRRR